MSTSGTDKLPVYLVPASQSERKSTGNSVSGKGTYFIPASHSWDACWELADDLLVEIKTSPEGAVIVTCLDLQEYGIGDSLEIAIEDLLTSSSDYLQSLESREEKLESSATEDLRTLRRLLRTQADKS